MKYQHVNGKDENVLNSYPYGHGDWRGIVYFDPTATFILFMDASDLDQLVDCSALHEQIILILVRPGLSYNIHLDKEEDLKLNQILKNHESTSSEAFTYVN